MAQGLKSIKCLLLAAGMAISSCALIHAQEYRGRIQGLVNDTSGSNIPGAVITLRNVKTGSTSTRVASETGHYLFDLIEPGSYDVSAEFQGFNRLAKEGVLLQSRGDVSVDFTLTPGDVRQTVTVEGAATALQFNTSKLETTVDSELTSNLPQLYRSPFLLAQLDPSVERSDSQSEYNPYNTDGANQQRVGGGANRTNDLQVDGTSVNIGFKTGYVPSPDMVQEVSIQQNAVYAEYGHGSGSAISLTLKSGTNEWHGNAFYQGQFPWANAVENRVFNTINKGRNHMFGVTLGNPVRKDHVFNFFAFEGWRKTDPGNLINTLPTELERLGDFSQSLNTTGGLRTIYDPWSTQTSADRQTITRSVYPGNRIPTPLLDPVATSYMAKLWKPNRPGDGAYFKVNNYYAPLPLKARYNNFSDRLDYDVNSRLRLSGRYSTYRTPVTADNPTGSELFLSDSLFLRR